MNEVLNTILVVLNYLSVFVMFACTALVATHKESKMQKLILLECVTLLICCVGFLIRIETTTLEVMVAAQKLIYGSVTHAMYMMLLFILKYCNFKIPSWLKWVFHGINFTITALVLFDDRLHLLYKSTSLVDGVFTKEYGPLHTIAIIVFVFYMVASVAIAVLFSIKNIRKRAKYVWRMFTAVSIPCLSYLISKILGSAIKELGEATDVQPIGFAIFAVLLIIMVYRDNLYDIKNIASEYSIESLNEALIIFDNNYHYKGCNDIAIKYFPILNEITLDSDIRKESEILTDIFDEKLKEYYFDDKIFDISIRSVMSGSREVGRVIWMSDVTVERKYTKLLESEVSTLSNISYKDQLTGLENRRSYEQNILAIKDSDEEVKVTIFTFDINGLKITNDTYGHATGDELIKEAAKIIESVFAYIGNVYRIGGDEFSVISVGDVDSQEMIKKFEEAVKSYKGSFKHNISISYGCADGVISRDGAIEMLIEHADKNMYKSKEKYYIESGTARRNS